MSNLEFAQKMQERTMTFAVIVGGIVALSTGRDNIPTEWLKAREPVQI